MSALYASIDSDARKTQATSRGYREISAHVRGWDSGVEVVAQHDETGDRFDVYVTTGSNGSGGRLYLGRVVDGAFEPYQAEQFYGEHDRMMGSHPDNEEAGR